MNNDQEKQKTPAMTETVNLLLPITINGVRTDRLVMRRPKLKDIRNASKSGR